MSQFGVEWGQYRRSNLVEMRPFIEGETVCDRVSISQADREAGSPKAGDMIARNPTNHDDQWLVAADYFAANFEVLREPVAWQWEFYDTVTGHSDLNLGFSPPKPVKFLRVRNLQPLYTARQEEQS